MAQSLRVLVFNSDASYAAELRSLLLRISGLKIVGELDEPSLLPQAVGQFPIDLVIAHLDPNVDFVLEITRQVIESRPGLRVFAISQATGGDVVLRALRAGIKEYLVKPLKFEELEAALGKQLSTSNAAAGKEPGKIISLIGSAGGVGCSTIAANLAVELSALIGAPKRVALVDMDFRFGHVATMLDIQAQFTIADLCDTPEQLDPQVINRALVEHAAGVRVLARPNTFAQAENITAAHCTSVLTALADMCDYVVIDGPTRQDPGAQTVLDAADLTLLVMQLLVPSVRNTDRICHEMAQHGFNMDRLRLVCNRVDADPGLLDQTQVEKTLGRQIFAAIPDDWKSVSASVNIGQPLASQWARSKVRQAIRSLAAKIHMPREAPALDDDMGGNLLGKLFGGFNKKKPGATAAELQKPLPAPA